MVTVSHKIFGLRLEHLKLTKLSKVNLIRPSGKPIAKVEGKVIACLLRKISCHDLHSNLEASFFADHNSLEKNLIRTTGTCNTNPHNPYHF